MSNPALTVSGGVATLAADRTPRGGMNPGRRAGDDPLAVLRWAALSDGGTGTLKREGVVTTPACAWGRPGAARTSGGDEQVLEGC